MYTINKVLVCITPQANSKRLINKGREIAEQVQGELHILHVEQGDSIFISEESSLLLQELFDYGSERGGIIHGVCGQDVPRVIEQFIKEEKITNVVLGASPPASGFSPSHIVNRLDLAMPYVDIHILDREDLS